jgi:DNA-binding transcriptional MerR regulator
MSPLVRIHEAAQRLGVSSETIRRWERVGLIPPATRTVTGHRVYSDADLEAVRIIVVPERQHA